MPGGQPTEHGTGGHRLAGGDRHQHRLVGRAQAALVQDGDHAAPGQHTGVADHPRPGGQHRQAGPAGEIDTAVPGTVGSRRWQKATNDHRPAG